MKHIKENIFFTMCRDYFKFLEDDFGCEVSYKESVYGTIVTYKNNTTAIDVNFQPREAGIVYIWLMRLIDGKIPSHPIKIRQADRLDIFDLEDLLSIKMPSLKIERPTSKELAKPFSEKIFEKTIKQLSNALREYGHDILKGNFDVFSELENVVKERTSKKA